MIKSGVSHSFLGLIILLFQKELVESATSLIKAGLPWVEKLFKPEWMLYLNHPYTQIIILTLACFSWGALHHIFLIEKEK
ncbi:MAG: hypothetical protein OCD00_03855 [Colwellia sp.]